MYRVNRSTNHQALRDQLATVVSELKRDYREMEAPDIMYGLGYIGALTYAIKVEVQNTIYLFDKTSFFSETWGHEHDTLRGDVQQTNLLLVRLNERLDENYVDPQTPVREALKEASISIACALEDNMENLQMSDLEHIQDKITELENLLDTKEQQHD